MKEFLLKAKTWVLNNKGKLLLAASGCAVALLKVCQ
jgi:hypothetical protein